MIVGITEAKARFAELVDLAAVGEEVVITRRVRAIASLVAVTVQRAFRVNRDLLRRRVRPGATVDQIIREDRDSRD